MKKLLFIALFSVILFFSHVTSSSAATFKDLRADHSLMPEIQYLAQQNILTGYQDGTFKPDAPIAKQHIAVLLVRALNLPTTNIQNPGYKDVPTTHMYYKEIAAAYTAGLFSKADYFRPQSTISRGFMAKLLASAFNLQQLPPMASNDDFLDVPRSHGYYADIMKITSNNIANGFQDGTYKPAQTLTRAHFAAFLARGLTLKTINFNLDTNYNYYFLDDKGTRTKISFQENLSATEQLWQETNMNTNEVMNTIYISETPRYYSYGVYETDLGYYMYKPASVRTLTTGVGDGMHRRETIISTNGSLKIGDTLYTNLIVTERYEPYVDETYFRYFAENIGVLATSNSKGKLTYYFEKRERK